MGEAGRRFRDRGEIVTSCDATTSPRSVTAFRQHLLCRHPIPASLRALLHALLESVFRDDRSPWPATANCQCVGRSGDPVYPSLSDSCGSLPRSTYNVTVSGGSPPPKHST